jgi:type VI secretion system protein ImpA
LVQVVLEKFDKQAPSLTEVRQAVEDCRHIVERLLAQKRELEPDLVEEEEGGHGTGPARAGGGDAHLRDRAQALAQLQAVAGFFRRTEPHSPVAYLVERAVRWASMPLEDWLSDVIGGETALYTIKSQLGIRDPEESS